MAGLPVDILAQGTRIFNEYEGGLVENYVAQQLISAGQNELYYWRSKGGTAKLDFLYETGEHIIPLEVKGSVNSKSKRLKSYDEQFTSSYLIRSTLLNLKQDGKICNVPLYAIDILSSIISSNHT